MNYIELDTDKLKNHISIDLNLHNIKVDITTTNQCLYSTLKHMWTDMLYIKYKFPVQLIFPWSKLKIDDEWTLNADLKIFPIFYNNTKYDDHNTLAELTLTE